MALNVQILTVKLSETENKKKGVQKSIKTTYHGCL